MEKRVNLKGKSEKYANAKGITLIALVITIVIMAIMVMVSIQVAMETGLFESAGKATSEYKVAQEVEANMGITVNGENLDDYLAGIKSKEEWEEILANAKRHPNQGTYNTDIGIGTDGNPVNLDLWYYTLSGTEAHLGQNYDTSSGTINQVGYLGEIDETTGTIEGKIPQYIKRGSTIYTVTQMTGVFYNMTTLKKVPALPTTVTDIAYAFYGCSSLEIAPKIPETVTNMTCTFTACSSLKNAPIIPSNVTDLTMTFASCINLTGDLILNCSNLERFEGVLYNATVAEGTLLQVSGINEDIVDKVMNERFGHSNIVKK